MRVVAYAYCDPLLDLPPDPSIWGQEVDQVYQDFSVRKAALKPEPTAKGSTRKQPRAQLQQLLADCQAEPIDYLLVRRLEELGDSLEEVSDRLTQLETLGIKLVVLEADLSIHSNLLQNGEGLKLLQTLQREQRSRQIRQGHARNRIKALPPPGKAPYGYRRGKEQYVIDRMTAPVVKDFFEHFLLYGSLHGAVRFLEKKYSKKISASTGQRWLTNPVYRGDLAYQNGQVIANTHNSIISRDEAAQVDRLLRRNRRLPPRTASAPRSLAGLVVCGACQSSMTITKVSAPRRQEEYLYLRPRSCPNRPKCRAIAYEQILDQTIQTICEELPCAVGQANVPNIDQIKQGIEGAIAAKQAILDQLPDLIASGVLDPETADLRAYKLRTELSELQAKIAQLPPPNLGAIAQAVSIPEFWRDLSESERRFYFREFIRQIQLIRQADGSWHLELAFIF